MALEQKARSWHSLGENLRSDAHAPKSALRFGARFSSQTARSYELSGLWRGA